MNYGIYNPVNDFLFAARAAQGLIQADSDAKRGVQQDALEQRRYEKADALKMEDRDRAREIEDMQMLAARYYTLTSSEDGSPLPEEELLRRMPQINEVVKAAGNRSKAMRGFFTVNPDVDQEAPFDGVGVRRYKSGDKEEAKVHYRLRRKDGEPGVVTENRTSDPNDTIYELKLKDFDREMRSVFAGYGAAPPKVDNWKEKENYRDEKERARDEARHKQDLERDRLNDEQAMARTKAANEHSERMARIKTADADGDGGADGVNLITLKTGRTVKLDDLRKSYESTYGKKDAQGFTIGLVEGAPSFAAWANSQAAQPVFTADAPQPSADLQAQAERLADEWINEQAGWLSSDEKDFAQYGGNKAQAKVAKTAEFLQQLMQQQGIAPQGQAPQAQLPAASGLQPGQQAPIDPNKPAINNPDGSISTERTISVTVDGKVYNLPTIINGKQYAPDEAVELFRQGKNKPVGVFNSVQEATTAAQARSKEIGKQRDSSTQKGKGTLDPSKPDHKQIAMDYLKKAGGDKAKARELAKKDGWSF